MPQVRQSLSRQHDAGALVLVFVAAGAAAIAVSAVLHLDLWANHDYRRYPTVGNMFLLQGIVGCVLAATMLIVRRIFITAVGAMYMALSIGALFISLNGGFFDVGETIDARYVKLSLVDEIVGLVACVLAIGVTLGSRQRSDENP